MFTAQEALFKVMLQEGWFVDSDGEVNSPTGFFGYVHNTPADLPEIYAAFSDTTSVYGTPDEEDMVGAFTAYINSDGLIFINKVRSVEDAKFIYQTTVNEYREWLGEQ